MENARYWPYDEVSLSENGLTADITTPWLQISVALTESNKSQILSLVTKFQTDTLSAEDANTVQWFFSEFKHLPLCYILPSTKNDTATDMPVVKDETLVRISLPQFLTVTCGDLLRVHNKNSDVSSVLEVCKLTRQNWEWDADAAIAFASVQGKVHPESLLSVCRRFHLLDTMALNKGKECFEAASKLPKHDFALAAGLMVRQNHYVTEQCQAALKPAIDIAGTARVLVEDFLNEENGHDLILGVALKSVTDNSNLSALPATIQTQILMHLLKFAAQRNFLAFALVVDCFERSSFESTDPLANLLSDGGFEKAARHINRHKDINDAGEHENVAMGFLKFMSPVDAVYALEAIRITESVNLLINCIPTAAFETFHTMRTTHSSQRSE